jgi:hypothetical protein
MTENLFDLVNAYHRYTATRQSAELASVEEPLFTTLAASRRGRATTTAALAATDVIDQAGKDRIVKNRRFNDRFFDILVERLARLDLPGAAPAARRGYPHSRA